MSAPAYFTDRPIGPSAKTWIKHAALLLATLVTSTIAGTLYPFGRNQTLPIDDPQSFQEVIQFILVMPAKYAAIVGNAVYLLATNTEYLRYGASFSLSLLFILISHEMGHYVACRIYRVEATLPYFIPTPPLIGPAGTFGAFIKILSPMPSRKAVFDIGVAGPIAGFIALIPIAIIGIATMQPATAEQVANAGGIIFSDPPLVKIIGALLGKDPAMGFGNPFYFAAWVGLLVTALNLIPSGQLDGGHALYAVLGAGVHRWTGRIAFVAMAILSILGWFYYNSPSGFLLAVLLAVMMRVKHPDPYDQTPVGAVRWIIAIAALGIFMLSFVPFPIQIK
ncbi:MAG: site-2 protease family protein [Acidobacteriota bacterium]